MIENEEEDKNNLNNTVLEGMDVQGVWEDIDNQNQKKLHLEKLFDPNGPYSKHKKFLKDKKNKSKRRNRKKSNQPGSFLNRIDASIYRDEVNEDRNYGIASLFEDPYEKEIRLAELVESKKRKKDRCHEVISPRMSFKRNSVKYCDAEVQTECKIKVLSDDEEDKYEGLISDNKANSFANKQDAMMAKMDLLNSFNDQEVLNAFKLSLINTDLYQDSMSKDEFYDKIGKNFMTLLRKKVESPNNEFEKKFGEMNIQGEMSSDHSLIGDFGDIVPVNFEVNNSDVRKHQEWSIGEQKKLVSLLENRTISCIDESEWHSIAVKLSRTINSVKSKAKALSHKTMNLNKKRKIIENPLTTYHETGSILSLSKTDRDIHATSVPTELDNFTEELEKPIKNDLPNIPRKRLIEQILTDLPGKCGTKNQIFDLIKEKYNINLHEKSSPQYKGFHQTLSKQFKFRRGFYAIRTTCYEFTELNERLKSIDDCKSWKEKTFFILNQFPEKMARIDEIKQGIERILSSQTQSNERPQDSFQTWEKNTLKIFSKYDSLFDTTNAKSVYYLC